MNKLEERSANKTKLDKDSTRKCGTCGISVIEDPVIISDRQGKYEYFHSDGKACAKAVSLFVENKVRHSSQARKY